MIREYVRYVADFETTVENDTSAQTKTEVWSSAICEVGNLDPKLVDLQGSIDGFMDWCRHHGGNALIYFHNLKFDGSFIIDYLLHHKKWASASYGKLDDGTFRFIKNPNKMDSYTYKCGISSQGQWYSITLKFPDHIVEIRDSLKLLPFSVKSIGDSFKTQYRKLAMEYKGERYPDCPITDEEKQYIINDVLVMSEAMQMMLDRGLTRMTIGGCCLHEYKSMIKRGQIKALMTYDWNEIYPDLKAYPLDKETYGAENADEYIRRSYFGGWCYVVEGREGKVYRNGQTYDVNSLYPSRMHSESGCKYPVGLPMFFKYDGEFGNKVFADDTYSFIRFKCNFKLKEGYLPFIQVKNNFLYSKNEMLKTNLLYDIDRDCFCDTYEFGGQLLSTRLTMTMGETDWKRFNDFYHIWDLEILDYCTFPAMVGIFDEYIDKYKHQKLTTSGAEKQEAKLFLNNLYGKLASSDISSFKVPILHNGKVSFRTIEEHEKPTVHIAVGSAITCYTRDFTIRHAQENYHGPDKAGFIYADTDSLHMDCEAVNLRIDAKEFNCWKNEVSWDYAIFTRQKTYIEHVTHEDGEPVEPYYQVKCAGMTKNAKGNFIGELDNGTKKLTDFKRGLTVKGNLKPKRIDGGILLVENEYVMR